MNAGHIAINNSRFLFLLIQDAIERIGGQVVEILPRGG
jgi:hypothetical protein